MPLRILVVTSSMPDPPTSGATIRISQFCHRLAKEDRVTILTFGEGDAADGARALRADGIGVVLLEPPRRNRKRTGQLLSLGSRMSHLGGIFHSSSMQSALDEMLRPGNFDAVLVEGSLLMRHRFPPATPLVLDEHNLEFEALSRTARVERSPLRKVFNAVESSKFRYEEMAAWDRASICLFTSRRELEVATAMSMVNGRVVPNGVDLEYFAPWSGDVDAGSIVFTGTMSYRPNTDAVLHFVRDVLPLIHRVRPRVVLTLVGANVPTSIQRLAGDRIVVTGRVPDVRPHLGRAAVVVAPLRIGSGTRLKVLEALAMGKAVVSTTLGSEGIDVEHEEHVLLADAPQPFADAVLRLLDDRDAARAMGLRGRALVEERYGWPLLARQLRDALREVAPVNHRTVRDNGPSGSAATHASILPG